MTEPLIRRPQILGIKSAKVNTPVEYKAGLEHAIAKGWPILHESRTYVRFTDTGAELFA